VPHKNILIWGKTLTKINQCGKKLPARAGSSMMNPPLATGGKTFPIAAGATE